MNNFSSFSSLCSHDQIHLELLGLSFFRMSHSALLIYLRMSSYTYVDLELKLETRELNE
jgi:hypothetical protein